MSQRKAVRARTKTKRPGVRNVVHLAAPGPPCHRCGVPTQIREHREITEKLLAQPFYYQRWYCCLAIGCRTTLIMPPEFIVWRTEAATA